MMHAAWPAAERKVIVESDEESRYQLIIDGRGPLEIVFASDSDSKHMPVALASMTAKYVRELMMIRLNRFFAGHLPELKPTAGYVEDGRRFLGEIEDLIESIGLEQAELVRSC